MSIGYQKRFWKTLKEGNIKGQVHFNEPLSFHTSFGIGGPARVFVMPSNKEDLKKILSLSHRNSMPYYILGNGSNLLVNDRGVDGIVVKLNGPFNNFNFIKDRLIAGGGADLSILRREAANRGLSGLEFTAGIPGTLGGAIAMNAGTGASSIGELVRRIEIMDKRGRVRWHSGKQIHFSYRSTSIRKGSIILKAELVLKSAPPFSIKKRIDSICRKRKSSQPLREKSAGSIFKNPCQGHCEADEVIASDSEAISTGRSAGFLIEKAGLKGMSCGGAFISPIHANFIINRGGAKARDVTRLIKIVQREVLKQFGIRLEPEIVMW